MKTLERSAPKKGSKVTPQWILDLRASCIRRREAILKKNKKDLEFLDGNQWTPEQQATFEDQNRPVYVDNQLFIMNEFIQGLEVERNTKPHLKPRGLSDVKGALVLNHQFDYLWGLNNGEAVNSDVAGWARTYGYGVAKIYRDDRMGENHIRMLDVDPRLFLLDPKSRRRDINEDAECCGEELWMSMDEAIRKFPKFKDDLLSMRQASRDRHGSEGEVHEDLYTSRADMEAGNVAIPPMQFWDHNDGKATYNAETDEVCITILQYRTYEPLWYLAYQGQEQPITPPEDGMTVEDAEQALAEFIVNHPEAELVEESKKVIREARFIGPVLLSDKPAPWGGEMFSYCVRWCYRDRHGFPYGALSQWLGTQEMINKIDQKILEILSTKRVKYLTEMMPGWTKEMVANEAAKPNAVFPMKGSLNGLEIDQDLNLSSAFYEMGESKRRALKTNTGINDEVRGLGAKDQAFVTLQARQKQGMMALTRIFQEGDFFLKEISMLMLQAMRWEYSGQKQVVLAEEAGQKKWAAMGFTDPREIAEIEAQAKLTDFPIEVAGPIDEIQVNVLVEQVADNADEQDQQRDRALEWAKVIPDPIGQMMMIATALKADSMPGASAVADKLWTRIDAMLQPPPVQVVPGAAETGMQGPVVPVPQESGMVGPVGQ